MKHEDALTAVNRETLKRRRRRWIGVAILLVLALVGYSIYSQIGRASCRERVEISEVAV